jgi:ribosomal subunit interface protein
MLIHKHVKNLTDTEKAQFEEYLEKKIGRFSTILEAHYPDVDTVKLDVHIQKHNKHSAYEFEYVLHLPKVNGPIVTSETKHEITKCMDFATDKMEQRLIKHFKRLTRS